MKKKLIATIGLAMVLLLPAIANAVEPYQEYLKHVESAQKLTALTDSLMGDSINLYNGGTQFSVTDIDLPGAGLPVQLIRSFSIEIDPSTVDEVDHVHSRVGIGGLGEWNIEVPYISTTVSSTGWPATRCSTASEPSSFGPIEKTDFWHGMHVHLPGGSDRLLLKSYPETQSHPASNKLWTTQERDSFSCIPMQSGLAGEGFLMRTADGLLYHFNVGATKNTGRMTYYPLPGYEHFYSLSVNKYFLLASKVEDRHGNWVKYFYDNSGRPVSIKSNDNREILLNYAGDYLQSAWANNRTWHYFYQNFSPRNLLSQVILPDASK